MVCNICRQTVQDVRTGYYTCKHAHDNCDFDCCDKCFKGKDNEKAYVDNFDYNAFKQMTIDEKLDILPEVMLNEITLKETMKVPSHIHQLEKHDGKYARGGWNCDKIRGAKKCLSGLTGFF